MLELADKTVLKTVDENVVGVQVPLLPPNLSIVVIYVYESMKVYGPYTRKDGRQIVILKTPRIENRITISYPKYLVQCHIGRKLSSEETIDHIDGNFLNNNLSNLRIVSRSDHCRSHSFKKEEITRICKICGKLFLTSDMNRVTCSSPVCRGKCAHVLGYNRGNDFEPDTDVRYISLRDTLDDFTKVSDM